MINEVNKKEGITEEEMQFIRSMTAEERSEMYKQIQDKIALKNRYKLMTKLKCNKDIEKAMLEVTKEINLKDGKWSLVKDRGIIRYKDSEGICCGIANVESLSELIVNYFESFNEEGENKYKLKFPYFDELRNSDYMSFASYLNVSIKCSKDNAYRLIHDQLLFENNLTEKRGECHKFILIDGVEYVVYQSVLSTAGLLQISDYAIKHLTFRI